MKVHFEKSDLTGNHKINRNSAFFPLKCMCRCKVCREQKLKTRWDMKLKFNDFEAHTVSPMQRIAGECRGSVPLGWNFSTRAH